MALITKMREYRARHNITQDELAALVGVRRETIINLEKGRYNPSLKLAMDIAHVFSCTVEDLFSFSEEVK
ncbi:helix-turn-helix domain-containing protein [Anaerocolumna sedimenticola]|uniref:Helix-turn-helix domain-containing protein n=1 Tax=Anaerocolumna sedimenticola TaxID=2696063 RepID=A0A6P1TJN1_9FIRM|nr:helix-turn-helix transcriptional regulator [Anaerocolumna sedimenticola]QHQ60116.1 helix-turn-helix domain-containing protein [Anaerocolumna sedimenticola]